MKNNKNTKTFDFAFLQHCKDYDTDTEKIIKHLANINAQLIWSIWVIKTSSIPISEKIRILHLQVTKLYYHRYSAKTLFYLANRIGEYLFIETQEYKYRKQFAE